MSLTINLYNSIVNAGIIDHDDLQQHHRLRSINKFCLFTISIALVYGFVFWYLNWLGPCILIAFDFITFAGVIVLNYYRNYLLAKFLLIFTTALSVLSISIMLGFATGFHLYLYTSPLFIFWIFNANERKYITIAFLIYILDYLAVFYFKFYHEPYYRVDLNVFNLDLYSLNMLFTLFLLFGLFNNYSRYYQQSGELLLNKQKDLEAEIQLRKNSEANIRKLFEDLSKSYSNLESFNFIVSHNIRAPLTNIQGFIEMYDKTNQDSETNLELIDNIQLAANNLDGILSDLNEVLKSRKHLLEGKEYISLADVIRSIRISLSAEIEKSQTTIEESFAKDFKVFSIRTLLHSCLYNLIHNAMKYKRDGVAPRIQIVAHYTRSLVTIIVADNGQGIDLQRYKDRIFGLYNRFNNKIEGKGIGLYLVKTNIEMMGGEISVDSVLNEGTVFTIKLKKD